MVKLKKYTLNRIPKFVIYSLTNTYLSGHVKHIKVYDYSRDSAFQKMVDTFYVPIRFKLCNFSLPLNSLMFLADEHKGKAKFIEFAYKTRAESERLNPYLEVSYEYLAISPDFAWNVNMLLMDTWEYD